jgi:YfiH family protein
MTAAERKERISLMTFQAKNLDAPRIDHAFFGRVGGVSEGPLYAGLNCGQGSHDTKEHIAENRRIVAEHFGVTPDRFCTLYQVHSPNVVVVTEPTQATEKADALVTKTPNLLLGILTADCAPVLFADREAGIIGAAHAGWKGAHGGVVKNTIDAMLGLGARKENIAACIGPCIAQASYEIGPEMFDDITRPDPGAAPLFARTKKRGYYHFDLQGYVNRQLHAAGLQDIRQIAMDTYSNEAHFFSFRRTTHRGELDYGRHISCIMIRD